MKKKINLDPKNIFTQTPITERAGKTSPRACQHKVASTQEPPGTFTKPVAQPESRAQGPTQETLQHSLLFLMSKFALTQDKSYAEAAYQHLHMLAVRCDTDSKARFLYRSLTMSWAQVCRGQVTTDDSPSTGHH